MTRPRSLLASSLALVMLAGSLGVGRPDTARAADAAGGPPCAAPMGCTWTGTVKVTVERQINDKNIALGVTTRGHLSMTLTYSRLTFRYLGSGSPADGRYAYEVSAGAMAWTAKGSETRSPHPTFTCGGSGSGTVADPTIHLVMRTDPEGGLRYTIHGSYSFSFPMTSGPAGRCGVYAPLGTWPQDKGAEHASRTTRQLKGKHKGSGPPPFGNARDTVTASWDLGSDAGYKLSGTVTACPPDTVCPDAVPAEGVMIAALGTANGQAVTDKDGHYELELPRGSYRVGPADDHDRSIPRDRTVDLSTDRSGVDFRACSGGADGFVPCSSLAVTLAVTPSPVLVAQADEGPVPADVRIAVTIENQGDRPLYNVTLDPALVIGYQDATHADLLPLRPKVEGAQPIALETLAPGDHQVRTLDYVASGDGDLDVTALASYSLEPLSRTLTATGGTRLQLRTQLLVASARLERWTSSVNAPALIQAGTSYSIRVKLENRSYTRTLKVWGVLSPSGNADGGRWQPIGQPLDKEGDSGTGLAGCLAPPLIQLDPREAEEWDVVFRAMPSNPRRATAQPGEQGGGTRAVIDMLTPLVWIDHGEDAEATPAAADEIAVAPDARTIQVSIDDRAIAQETFSRSIAAAYYSKGAFEATIRWAGNLIHGIFIDLPVLLGKGLLSVPTLVKKYTLLQVELWDTVKHDPVLLAAYTNLLTNQLLLSLKEAPDAIKAGQAFWDQLNAAAYAHFEEMNAQWYAGDWRAAAESFGGDARTLELELAALIAPCVLTRLPKAAEALDAAKAARFAEASDELASNAGRATRAAEAVQVLGRVTEPGTPLSDALLRHLFGLTQEQIDWLRGWIKGKDLLYTFRSRASEALKWIGAYLKPEQFKLKTVDWIDVEYLGYQFDDIGRLILKEPIDRAAVERQLLNEGWGEGTKRWEDVSKRLDTREFEWFTDEPQYRRSMEAWAEKGEVDFKFNWKDNLVDPAAAPREPPKVAGFKLNKRTVVNPRTKQLETDWEVLVDPDRTGAWRSVTGDSDGVALTDAGGFGLDDARHIRFANQLRNSPLETPHLESASWTKDGEFVFPEKLALLNGQSMAQLGPDGVFRLVRFNEGLSDLRSVDNYQIWFDGQYIAP